MKHPALHGIMVGILLAACLADCAVAGERAQAFVGRWVCDNADRSYEYGYYVTDRYADGRYATKEYGTSNLDLPPEIYVEWGRWKLKGNRYLYIIDGTTSPYQKRFVDKWVTQKIWSITPSEVYFASDELLAVGELKTKDATPLLSVKMVKPFFPGTAGGLPVSAPFNNIPQWVDGYPK